MVNMNPEKGSIKKEQSMLAFFTTWKTHKNGNHYGRHFRTFKPGSSFFLNKPEKLLWLCFLYHFYRLHIDDFYIYTNIVLLCFWANSLHSSRIWLWMSDCSSTQCALNIHWSGTWLVPHETVAILVNFLCTPYNHAPVYSVNQSHIHKVYAHIAITCHLHF